MSTNTYPKFIWKGPSSRLDCNISIALAIDNEHVMVFAVALFNGEEEAKRDDEGYLASFTAEFLRDDAIHLLEQATLVAKLEDYWINYAMQEEGYGSVH